MPRGLWEGTENSNDSGRTSTSSVCRLKKTKKKKHQRSWNLLKINAGPTPSKRRFEIKYQGNICEGKPAEGRERIFAEQPFIDDRTRGTQTSRVLQIRGHALPVCQYRRLAATQLWKRRAFPTGYSWRRPSLFLFDRSAASLSAPSLRFQAGEKASSWHLTYRTHTCMFRYMFTYTWNGQNFFSTNFLKREKCGVYISRCLVGSWCFSLIPVCLCTLPHSVFHFWPVPLKKKKKLSEGHWDPFLSIRRWVFPEESSNLLEPSSICTQDQATMLLGDLQCSRLIKKCILFILSFRKWETVESIHGLF